MQVISSWIQKSLGVQQLVATAIQFLMCDVLNAMCAMCCCVRISEIKSRFKNSVRVGRLLSESCKREDWSSDPLWPHAAWCGSLRLQSCSETGGRVRNPRKSESQTALSGKQETLIQGGRWRHRLRWSSDFHVPCLVICVHGCSQGSVPVGAHTQSFCLCLFFFVFVVF